MDLGRFFMVPGRFLWLFMVPGGFFMVPGGLLFCLNGSRSFFTDPGRFFMVPGGFYDFSWFQVNFLWVLKALSWFFIDPGQFL